MLRIILNIEDKKLREKIMEYKKKIEEVCRDDRRN